MARFETSEPLASWVEEAFPLAPNSDPRLCIEDRFPPVSGVTSPAEAFDDLIVVGQGAVQHFDDVHPLTAFEVGRSGIDPLKKV